MSMIGKVVKGAVFFMGAMAVMQFMNDSRRRAEIEEMRNNHVSYNTGCSNAEYQSIIPPDIEILLMRMGGGLLILVSLLMAFAMTYGIYDITGFNDTDIFMMILFTPILCVHMLIWCGCFCLGWFLCQGEVKSKQPPMNTPLPQVAMINASEAKAKERIEDILTRLFKKPYFVFFFVYGLVLLAFIISRFL